MRSVAIVLMVMTGSVQADGYLADLRECRNVVSATADIARCKAIDGAVAKNLQNVVDILRTERVSPMWPEAEWRPLCVKLLYPVRAAEVANGCKFKLDDSVRTLVERSALARTPAPSSSGRHGKSFAALVDARDRMCTCPTSECTSKMMSELDIPFAWSDGDSKSIRDAEQAIRGELGLCYIDAEVRAMWRAFAPKRKR